MTKGNELSARDMILVFALFTVALSQCGCPEN
jgi:hypothetical protein